MTYILKLLDILEMLHILDILDILDTLDILVIIDTQLSDWEQQRWLRMSSKKLLWKLFLVINTSVMIRPFKN